MGNWIFIFIHNSSHKSPMIILLLTGAILFQKTGEISHVFSNCRNVDFVLQLLFIAFSIAKVDMKFLKIFIFPYQLSYEHIWHCLADEVVVLSDQRFSNRFFVGIFAVQSWNINKIPNLKRKLWLVTKQVWGWKILNRISSEYG